MGGAPLEPTAAAGASGEPPPRKWVARGGLRESLISKDRLGRTRLRVPESAAHLSGVAGSGVVALFLLGLTVPPSGPFPESPVAAFHAFFVGVVSFERALPAAPQADWLESVEEGDVIFASRGPVPWGEWSHAAMVVRAPADSRWVEPGSLAVMEASIHDGMYVGSLDYYRDWPRIRVRRVSDDPEFRRRLAEAALEHRHRIFAGALRPGAPYSNCTSAVIGALQAVGMEPGIRGWRTPDELYRSPVWLR